ncbi:MAG: co-chaperone GroES [Dehalococcoidia bacterium]|nr:co-chaperone GroES [Dehalococcoidia bacterium]
MSAKLQPYGDRVVVTTVTEDEVLSSGIVIPDTAKEKPLQGEVIAIGPGKWEDGNRRPLDIAVGDRILYRKYAGQEFKLGTDEFLVIEEKDILGKVVK